MKKSNVIGFARPEPFTDVLTDLLRTGARELIEQAVEAELAEFMKQFGGRMTPDLDGDRSGHGTDSEGTLQGWGADDVPIGPGAAVCAQDRL